MSALNPLPNATFAIPDFVGSLRGGKLIRRGISHRGALQRDEQSCVIKFLTELTEFFQINQNISGGSDSVSTLIINVRTSTNA
jgi:hypothetical protein